MQQLLIPGSELYDELQARVQEQRSSFGEISVDEILISAARTVNNPDWRSGYYTTLEDHQRYFFDILVGYAQRQLTNTVERVMGDVLSHSGHQIRILDMYQDKSMHVMLAHPEIENIDNLGREFHQEQEIKQALRL